MEGEEGAEEDADEADGGEPGGAVVLEETVDQGVCDECGGGVERMIGFGANGGERIGGEKLGLLDETDGVGVDDGFLHGGRCGW